MSDLPDPWVEDPNNDVSLFVSFRDLEISYLLSPKEYSGLTAPFRNIYDAILYHIGGQTDRKSKFYRIKGLSGYLKPGESTLVLSPPGAGRSSLLKTVSLSLPVNSGDVLFNGMTKEEAHESGAQLNRALKYVGQTDLHFDELTVYETIQFAHRLTSPNPSPHYLDHLIEVFGMSECRNTLTSSCSGGQRRRLSTMVGLSNPSSKLICFDSYSDGLDSATTERITRYLSSWARANNSSFLATLQQPAPTVFNLFDKIIVLRDGEIVFNGPTVDVENYFTGMGYQCPHDIDLPSHISHITTNPKVFLLEQQLMISNGMEKGKGKDNKALVDQNGQNKTPNGPTSTQISNTISPSSKKSSKRTTTSPSTITTSLGPLVMSSTPVITLEEMTEYYRASPFSHHVEEVLDHIEALRLKKGLPMTKNMKKRSGDDGNGQSNDGNEETQSSPPENTKKSTSLTLSNPTISSLTELTPVVTPNTKKYYGPGYAASIPLLFNYVLHRQLRLNMRNISLMISRLIPAIIISVVISGLYFQLRAADYNLRFASLMDPLIEYGYNNMIELGIFIMYRPLLSTQLDLYPTWTYVAAVQLAGIPLSLIETFIFASITYGMVGHSGGVLEIFTHYFILWIHGVCLSALFRFGASLSVSTSHAYAVVSPAVSVMAFCAGYYIKYTTLPVYAKWIYWISIFGSAFRGLTINEFTSPRYDYLIPSPEDPNIMERAGDIYLKLNGLPTDQIWILMSCIYSIGLTIILIGLTSYFLYSPYLEYSIGTRRFASDDENVDGGEFLMDKQQHLDEMKQDDIELLKTQQALQEQHDAEFQQFSTQNHLPDDRDDDHGGNGDIEGNGGGYNGNNGNNGGVELTSTPNYTTNNNNNHEFSRSSTHNRSINNYPVSCTLSRSNIYSKSKSKSRFAAGNCKLQTLTNDLPFTPATLAFKDVKFTVKALDSKGKQYNRVLLQNVSGYAQQGTCTALMGSSGAGKSTLLNTLMGLNVTTGSQRVSGSILVNGVTLTPQQFSSIVGYVEQFETLYPFDSVYETLLFSARMRLESNDSDILHRVVTEVIEILELVAVKDYLIGSPDNPVLSPSQKKLVSIGVELVANPSILFLDEPTTGLDSESAIAVCRAISSIARSGRAVICTIHQPSAQLFLNFFDNLLLLGSGGYTMFFGRLGLRAMNMIDYFQTVNGFEAFPNKVNPAEHLVEQVSIPLPPQVAAKAEQMYNSYYFDYNPDNDDDSNPNSDDEDGLDDIDMNNGDANGLTKRSNITNDTPRLTKSQSNNVIALSSTAITDAEHGNDDGRMGNQVAKLKRNKNNTSLNVPAFSSLNSRQQYIRYLYLKYLSSPLREKADEFLHLVMANGHGDNTTNNKNQIEYHSDGFDNNSNTNDNRLSQLDHTNTHSSINIGTQSSITSGNNTEITQSIDGGGIISMMSTVEEGDDGTTSLNYPQRRKPANPQPLHPHFRQQPNTLIIPHTDNRGVVAAGDNTNNMVLQPLIFNVTTQKAPVYLQFLYLLQRQWHLYSRFTEFFYTRFLSAVLTNIVFGLLYLNLKIENEGSIITFFASTVFAASMISYVMSTTALPIYNFLTRTVFYREQFCNYYQSWLWPLTFLLCEAVWIMPVTLGSLIPIYFMIGSTSLDAAAFFGTLFAGYFASVVLCVYALALSLSLPEFLTEVALNVSVACFFALQGIGSPKPATNSVFKVFMSVDLFFYLNRAVTVLQFGTREGSITVYENGMSAVVSVKDWVANYTGFNYSNGFGWSLLWSTVMLFTFLTAAIIGSTFLRPK